MCVYIHLALPLSSNLAMCLFYFLGFNFLTHIYLHSKHNCNKNKEQKKKYINKDKLNAVLYLKCLCVNVCVREHDM
jgi:hypothetical protein